MNINSKLWLWGHGRQCDNLKDVENPDLRGRPAISKISLSEAARYMGIPNICRIALETVEAPPFDEEVETASDMEQIVWSVLGCGRLDARNDLDEVLRLASKYNNITGGIMDDFFPFANPEKTKKYTPEILHHFANELHNNLSKKLDLWVVVYTKDLDYERLSEYLEQCDVITLWTWNVEDLDKFEDNYRKLRKICPDKRILTGCYMWDFPNQCEIPLDVMKKQLDFHYNMVKSGETDGIIFCHNYVVDLGLEAVEYTRKWIKGHI